MSDSDILANSNAMTNSDVYKELCTSYRAIDDFRTKLLGILPLATAGGVVALLSKDVSITGNNRELLEPLAIFGVFVTIGLYAYELYGIKKCHYLIETGKHLESQAKIPGQFVTRPSPALWVLHEPFAAAVIYPAVLAAWAYMAVDFFFRWVPALIVSIVVFLVGFYITIRHTKSLGADWSKDHPELKKAAPPTA